MREARASDVAWLKRSEWGKRVMQWVDAFQDAFVVPARAQFPAPALPRLRRRGETSCVMGGC